MPANKKGLVWQKLVDLNRAEVERFMLAMQRAVQRQITVVRVLPLHGCPLEFDSIVKAVEFVDSYEYSAGSAAPFVKYEIRVRYNNGDRIEASFEDRIGALTFLNAFVAGNWTTVVEVADEPEESV